MRKERLVFLKQKLNQDFIEYYDTPQMHFRQNELSWLIEQAGRVEGLEGNVKRHKDVNVELCKRIAELEMKYENTGSMFGRQNQRLLIEENTRLREALVKIYGILPTDGPSAEAHEIAKRALERGSK